MNTTRLSSAQSAAQTAAAPRLSTERDILMARNLIVGLLAVSAMAFGVIAKNPPPVHDASPLVRAALDLAAESRAADAKAPGQPQSGAARINAVVA